jgi:hypothetical protein
MATCAILGQALGTAVALAVKVDTAVEDVNIEELQQTLMEDDCYIPWHARKVPKLSLSARVSSEIVRNGLDRGEENLWIGHAGDCVTYEFDSDVDIRELRLVFDNDMNRKYHNMPCYYPLVETKYKLPATLIKEYVIEAENSSGEKFCLHVTDNHQRLVKHLVDWKAKTVKFTPIKTHGCEEMRLFDFEVK